jgi:hypothetical protein
MTNYQLPMKKILISHPIYQGTIDNLGITKFGTQGTEFASIGPDIFWGCNDEEEILYIPSIATNQVPDEHNDPTLIILRESLVIFQPDVLIVGNNTVPKEAIAAWRKAVEERKKLLIIRRGVDTRSIDKLAAKTYNVLVDNLPGINSPYVAQHMINYLQIERGQSNSKIAIIGAGNIGKNIAIKAIDSNLNVCLLSPSLQNQKTRLYTLKNRSIPSEKVICANSMEEVWEQADFVAIAIPWQDSLGKTHGEIIKPHHLKNLGKNARIVSASVPGIFSDSALDLMNKLVREQKIYVRIDTPKRHVERLKQKYPYIDAAHDRAFAAPECQQQLDRAMLTKARQFVQTLEKVTFA